MQKPTKFIPSETILAWVGGGYLDSQFKDYGFDVRRIPFYAPKVLNWDRICEEIGAKPDILVYADASIPPPLVGVEQFPCLTMFYCVDSHIHSWYPSYAQAFDLCAVSLKDHVDRMQLRLDSNHVFWLPPFPIRGERPPASPPEKKWDVLFVGHVDPTTTPVRKSFLDEFRKGVKDVAVRTGSFEKLFPCAKIVLNIAERGDLNFRVFEALATGACLLTPKIENGQDELFKNGQHLFTYELNNPQDAIEKANYLLSNPGVCEKIGEAGRKEIDAKHRRRHRVELIVEKISEVNWSETIRNRVAQASFIRENI